MLPTFNYIPQRSRSLFRLITIYSTVVIVPCASSQVHLFALKTEKLFGLVKMDSLNRVWAVRFYVFSHFFSLPQWSVAATLTKHCTHPEGGTNLMNALEVALQELASPERFVAFPSSTIILVQQ